MALLFWIEITFLQAGMLFGALLGALLGLIPLIVGIKKKNFTIGIIGFIASIIGNAILGLLLSLPIIGISLYLILRKSGSTDLNEDLNAENVDGE